MSLLKSIAVSLTMIASSISVFAESKYDVSEFYEVVTLESGTKAVSRNGSVSDAEYLLLPTKVDKGKYVVKVKKIGDNLYKIIDSDLCVQTRYCHEWASYGEEVVLIVDSNYGYNKGSIIFD